MPCSARLLTAASLTLAAMAMGCADTPRLGEARPVDAPSQADSVGAMHGKTGADMLPPQSGQPDPGPTGTVIGQTGNSNSARDSNVGNNIGAAGANNSRDTNAGAATEAGGRIRNNGSATGGDSSNTSSPRNNSGSVGTGADGAVIVPVNPNSGVSLPHNSVARPAGAADRGTAGNTGSTGDNTSTGANSRAPNNRATNNRSNNTNNPPARSGAQNNPGSVPDAPPRNPSDAPAGTSERGTAGSTSGNSTSGAPNSGAPNSGATAKPPTGENTSGAAAGASQGSPTTQPSATR